MSSRRSLAQLVVAILIAIPILSNFSSFADTSTQNWVATPPKDQFGNALPGYIGVDSKPSQQLLLFPSYLVNFSGTKGSPTQVSACSSLSDPLCAGGYLINARAELQPCTTSNPTDCFLELIVKDASGKTLKATQVTDVMQPMKQNFQGNQKAWLPTGGNPLIFKIPDAVHAGGDLYLVKPDLLMSKPAERENFNLTKFEAGIYPIKIRALTTDTPTQSGASTTAKDYGGQIEIAGAGDQSCEDGLSDGKNCFVPEVFPVGISFGMKLRLSQSLYGWLHGRFQDPEVTLSANPNSATGVDLQIVAKPIKVPIISGFIKSEGAPTKILDYFKDIPRWGQVYGLISEGARSGPLSGITIAHNHIDPSEATYKELSDWLEVLSDTSASEPSYWLVQTIIGGNGDQVEKCTKDTKALAGIVSTNATSYLPGPPRFDNTEQTLDYKVLAPHYAKDKSVFLGTYNLVINGDLARCIYGFTKAQVGATISVVSSDGAARLATTLVKQDEKFVSFAIAGFEFSNPTVRVKFTQTLEATPSPSASSTPSPVATKATTSTKKTITCVKGTKKTKITGTNPKCPTGFKKA